jgi:adenylate kinase family enzyme
MLKPYTSDLFKVEQISLRGPGVLILTGPSSCGKGEVAAALRQVMNIPASDHLSMGEILRTTISRAKNDESYATLLRDSYQISAAQNIFTSLDADDELIEKIHKHLPRMESFFERDNMAEFTSQLDWLEYCTLNGLLVPDRWTQNFIAAHIEHDPRFKVVPFIIDGYPRTIAAARHLLNFLASQHIPVMRVLHLSISKQEMIFRAQARGRADDDNSSLLRRFQFYVENVQPSVDFMKVELGCENIALIDAHQPVFFQTPEGKRKLDLSSSIANVVADSLRSLGVPRVIVRDIMDELIRARAEQQK